MRTAARAVSWVIASLGSEHSGVEPEPDQTDTPTRRFGGAVVLAAPAEVNAAELEPALGLAEVARCGICGTCWLWRCWCCACACASE
jgi:hypothetical protein